MAIVSAHPFVMFPGEGPEALDFYLAVIPGARAEGIERYGPGDQGPEGKLKRGRLTIADQTILLFDSPVKHAFGLTPAVSFFLDCQTPAEVGSLAAALGDGGQYLMPTNNYGFSQMFAWVQDRFGVSWQINCP